MRSPLRRSALFAEFDEILQLSAPESGTDTSAQPARQSGSFALAASILCLAVMAAFLSIGWSIYSRTPHRTPNQQAEADPTLVAGRIICAESNGNSKSKNKRSSASGAAQFIDETWLRMVRTHRPDLAQASDKDVFQLRYDAKVASEITQRLVERSTQVLRRSFLSRPPTCTWHTCFGQRSKFAHERKKSSGTGGLLRKDSIQPSMGEFERPVLY
jgi:hypothetical protein